MSIQESDLSIYDMYVLNSGGAPIFAGCTLTDYCKEHADQHPLHTGFLSAILSFGEEVFSGNLEKISFPNVKINMKTVGEYTSVFVNPGYTDDDLIQSKLNDFTNLFKEKYEKHVKPGVEVSEELFHKLLDDMFSMGLIPQNRMQSTKHYFVDDKGENDEQSQNLVSRFKEKFRRLVKR